MKQHITLSQLSELKQPELHKLYRWCLDKKYVESVSDIDWVRSDMQLSIGQMIEFLDESNPLGKGFSHLDATKGTTGLEYFWLVVQYDKHYKEAELCDALWEAIKEQLK